MRLEEIGSGQVSQHWHCIQARQAGQLITRPYHETLDDNALSTKGSALTVVTTCLCHAT